MENPLNGLAAVHSKGVILLLFIHYLYGRIVCGGFVLGSCFVVLGVLSSLAIILLRKRELA